MIKNILLLCFLFYINGRVFAEEELDGNVLVLKNSTFDLAIKLHKNILVEFYAPWCGHCKALAPEYAKAADALKEEESEIRLAKVDATEQIDLAERFQVKGYPTLLFFINGSLMKYKGARTSEAIIEWIKRKSDPPAVTLTTVDELIKFRNESQVGVLGLFNSMENQHIEFFNNVARQLDGVNFSISTEPALFKKLNIEGTERIILFKKSEEEKARNDFNGEQNAEELKRFIHAYRLDKVAELSTNTVQSIFSGDIKIFIFLLANKSSEDFPQLIGEYKESAARFRGKVLFVYINTNQIENEVLYATIGVKKEEFPAIRLISDLDNQRYKPKSNELVSFVITQFVQDVLDGKLKPSLLSQEVPDDWDARPVKILVGKNFNEVVRNRSKNVLVLFYAPWCGHSKNVTPIYDELAERFKESTEILFAKIDSTANEVEDHKIQRFPTIKLFLKDSDEVFTYNEKSVRTLETLTNFITSNGKEHGPIAKFDDDEEKKEEKKENKEEKQEEKQEGKSDANKEEL